VAHAPRLRNGIALQGDTPAKARGGVIPQGDLPSGSTWFYAIRSVPGYGDDEQHVREQRRTEYALCSAPVIRGTNREIIPSTSLIDWIVWLNSFYRKFSAYLKHEIKTRSTRIRMPIPHQPTPSNDDL
jgi:hypothetical protein